MDMLGHHDVSDNDKLMALAYLFHDFEEEIARGACREARGADSNWW
jgi:hypothetical protein